MSRRLIVLASGTLAAFGLTGCAADTAANAMVFSELAVGYYSGITSQRFEVTRDHTSFTDLWSDHARASGASQPDVSFDQEMVIAVFLGNRATGGYGITITRVEAETDRLVVNVKASFPGTGCAVTQALSQPYHVVTVPQSDKVVAFNATVERSDCPSPS